MVTILCRKLEKKKKVYLIREPLPWRKGNGYNSWSATGQKNKVERRSKTDNHVQIARQQSCGRGE
jgi:hypothetical protein